MNDHRPSQWCTPPAATAARHHICDDAHRRQQPLPSIVQRHQRSPPARHRTPQTATAVRVCRALSSATIAFAMMCTAARRHRLWYTSPRSHRPCDARSSTTTWRARALVTVAFTATTRERTTPSVCPRRRQPPSPCSFAAYARLYWATHRRRRQQLPSPRNAIQAVSNCHVPPPVADLLDMEQRYPSGPPPSKSTTVGPKLPSLQPSVWSVTSTRS